MKTPELEPLPPEVEGLLERERSLLPPPAGAQQAVLAQVTATLLAGPPAAGAASEAGASAGATGVKALLASKLVTGAVLFVLGGVSGAAGHALYLGAAAPEPVPAPVAAPAPTPAAIVPPFVAATPPPSEPIAPPTPPVAPASAPRLREPARAVATPSRAPEARDNALAAERRLLEVARTALSRGQSGAAIKGLEEHAASYASGQLAEEREALWIQALVSEGRYPDARAKGAQFHKKFPRSMLGETVDATLASIP